MFALSNAGHTTWFPCICQNDPGEPPRSLIKAKLPIAHALPCRTSSPSETLTFRFCQVRTGSKVAVTFSDFRSFQHKCHLWSLLQYQCNSGPRNIIFYHTIPRDTIWYKAMRQHDNKTIWSNMRHFYIWYQFELNFPQRIDGVHYFMQKRVKAKEWT